jgi:hypothetical protein
MNKLDQAMEAADALEKPVILVAKGIEEVTHGFVLVGRARKVVREATAGLLRSSLGFNARRPTDSGDKGTCEFTAVW